MAGPHDKVLWDFSILPFLHFHSLRSSRSGLGNLPLKLLSYKNTTESSSPHSLRLKNVSLSDGFVGPKLELPNDCRRSCDLILKDALCSLLLTLS